MRTNSLWESTVPATSLTTRRPMAQGRPKASPGQMSEQELLTSCKRDVTSTDASHREGPLSSPQNAVRSAVQRVERLSFCPKGPNSQRCGNRRADVAQELKTGRFPPSLALTGVLSKAQARSRQQRAHEPVACGGHAHARWCARSLRTRKCEGEESHVGGAGSQLAWGSLSRWPPRSRWNRRCWRRSSLTWVSSLTTRPRTMWTRNERPTRARGAAGCRCWRPWPTWPRPRRSITASPTWGKN